MITKHTVDIYALSSDSLGLSAVETQRGQSGVAVHVVESVKDIPTDGIAFIGYNGTRIFGWLFKNLMVAAHRLTIQEVPEELATRMVVLVRRTNWEHLRCDVRSVVKTYVKYAASGDFQRMPWGAAGSTETEAWLAWWRENRPSWDITILERFEEERRRRQEEIRPVRLTPSEVIPARAMRKMF